MYLVYGQIDLLLPYCCSLKEKRKIINSVITRIRHKFNLSIAEIKCQDLWQKSVLGFSAVSYKHSDLLSFISAIESVLDRFEEHIQILSFDYQILKDA